MPVYEFVCNECKREFEELVMSKNEVIECPSCGSRDARKLMSAFAVTGSARKASASSCGTCKPSAGKCKGCCG